jgi:Fe2+ transport system protein FeoA
MTDEKLPTEIPLANMPPGSRGRITRYLGGRMFRARLVALGINLGQEVQVIQNHRGLIILGVNSGRVALGRGVSQKIFITPEN